MSKIGRNERCVCGSGLKYKKCCLGKRDSQHRRTIKFGRDLFISKPYLKCPNCGCDKFGVCVLSSGGANSYSRECIDCGHSESYKLPKLKKKVIYLDQFVVSNLTKALDPDCTRHDKVLGDKFWIELYTKLERLSKLQLIICPDSFFHSDESLLCNDPTYDSLKCVYEHLSNGYTFTTHNEITRYQIQKHVSSWINNKPKEWPEIEIDHIIHGDIHSWQPKIRVGVNRRPWDGEKEGLIETKNTQYAILLDVFSRWNQEAGKKFMEWVQEEAMAFGTATIKNYQSYIERAYRDLPQKYAQQYLDGEEINYDINDLLPPPSKDIIDDISLALRKNGITGNAVIEKTIEYLHSPEIINVPSIHISSLLFAALARKAASGQKRPPSPGTFTDVNAISSLLPFCDAMFIDKEMANLMSESPLDTELQKYETKIFSFSNRLNFLEYLNEIEMQMPESHKKLVNDVYGDSWEKPYLDLIIHHKKDL